MRLQKYMAECGVASRRKCEEIIAQGRVSVNGSVVSEMGVQVEDGDEVLVDGKPVKPEKRRQYILLNKPQGVVTTLSDPQGRKTVRDLITDIPERIYPVGRLDYETEGLLILTNDGELMQGITHPSREVEKLYVARVRGQLTEQALGRLCGLTSVSVAEVLILSGIFAAVFYLAWQVRGLIARPQKGQRAVRMGLTVLCVGLSVYAGFCLLWGVFYGADSFQDKSGLTARGGTVEELTALTQR